MTQEEIKDYISNNLKVDIAPFGSGEFEVRLLLEGEVISRDFYTTD